MVCLPKGVGLVRISSPLGIVILASDRLTRREEEIARVAATVMGRGCPIVILSELEIARLLEAA